MNQGKEIFMQCPWKDLEAMNGPRFVCELVWNIPTILSLMHQNWATKCFCAEKKKIYSAVLWTRESWQSTIGMETSWSFAKSVSTIQPLLHLVWVTEKTRNIKILLCFSSVMLTRSCERNKDDSLLVDGQIKGCHYHMSEWDVPYLRPLLRKLKLCLCGNWVWHAGLLLKLTQNLTAIV